MHEYPLEIPTLDTESNVWSTTTFETEEEFLSYVESQFKLPGEYKLKNTKNWKQAGLTFDKEGIYIDAPRGSAVHKKFWKAERNKVLNGAIIDNFYLPPFYYFYLNYARIFIKELKRVKSPAVWDSDYHFFLYIMLCVLKGKHAVVLKTRQRGYSYKIMSILYWSYMWFEGSVNTIGASDIGHVKKTWGFLDVYRNHMNSNTPWIRGPYMPKSLEWKEFTPDENGKLLGNGSTLKGVTFQQSPTKGVGGHQSWFFYEESGIAPTIVETVGYIRPAIKAGNKTTGTIILSGSVGDLDDCEGLKKIFYHPIDHDFLDLPNIFEENPEYRRIGFFVPESWSFVGFIDKDGNSDVTKATEYILEARKSAKETKDVDDYRLELSQAPLTPSEAFAWRKESYFPLSIVNRQLERLDIERPKLRRAELFENAENKVKFKYYEDNEGPLAIHDFNLSGVKDKRGCVVILEEPDPQAPWLTYFAGVDPVETGKTTTSESLYCVYIFKNLVETRYTTEDDPENVKVKLAGFKPVAWYIGRYDDLKDTNQIGEYLIRLYNAKAVIESNIINFINHMQARNMTKHMFTKEEIGFLETIHANTNVHKTYGVHMTENIKAFILQNLREYVSEVLDVERKDDTGQIFKTTYGAERIKDRGVLQEMRDYTDNLNTDRLIALGLVVSIAKHYMINGIYVRITDVKKEKEFAKPPARSFFKTRDGNLDPIAQVKPKQFFKRLR